MPSELSELNRNLMQAGAHLQGAVKGLQTACGHLFEVLKRVPRLKADDLDRITSIAIEKLRAAPLINQEPKAYVVVGCALLGGALVCAATHRSKKLTYLICGGMGAIAAGILACRMLYRS